MSVNPFEALDHIQILNCLAKADEFGQHTPDNPEYFRGQVELLASLTAMGEDTEAVKDSLIRLLGVPASFSR